MADEASELLSGLVIRPALRSRNEIGYVTSRAWRADAKKSQVKAFKREKAAPTSDLIATAAGEIEAVLRKYAPISDAVVTSVPCGHSRRPDCFGKRLAQRVSEASGLPFVQVWEDRFCSGVSHPKEFKNLPPLVWKVVPETFTIIVDDIATSGWHLEEALNALRGRGIGSMALAWIGGTVGENRHRGQSQADGSSDRDEDRPRSPFGNSRGVWRLPGR